MTDPTEGSTLAGVVGDRASMLEEVLGGLALPQKEISSKYFYDAHGSELFERITRLDEYYPTRTERGLLLRWASEWVARHRPSTLVELGAGSAAKTRILLDAMLEQGSGRTYVPVDVSGDFLQDTADRLREEYPGLDVQPAVADMSSDLDVDLGDTPAGPRWFALLGSTIGNFEETEAIRLMASVAGLMGDDDRFLLGADRRPGPHKSVARLERAYDDADGVTAAFNLNVLSVLNRELGADFDIDAWVHRAFYEPTAGRIEMHLVAAEPQVVHFEGGAEVSVSAGESIRTEISCKYDRPTLDRALAAAGLAVEEWVEDREGLFALVLARRLP